MCHGFQTFTGISKQELGKGWVYFVVTGNGLKESEWFAVTHSVW
jgi:hypothetical protein